MNRAAATAPPGAHDPRRVVLLTAYYPPSPEVGGLRAEKVARAIQAAGHEVIVITTRLQGDSGDIRLAEPGLTVRTVVPWRNARQWYASWKKRGRKSAPPTASSAPAGDGIYTIPEKVPLWKRFIFSLMWLPDDQQGFIPPAVRAARPLLRGPRRAAIYSTAPPFSTHLAGLRLKHTGAPWIAEFRDPWTDNAWKPWHVRTGLSDRIERWLERRVLRRADRVVAVSEGIETLLRPRVADPGHLMLIRNGIDRLLAEPGKRITTGPVRIVHVGSFYFGRDPRPFLKALAAVRRRHGLTPSQVRVHLVGNCRWFSGVSVEQAAAAEGVSDLIEFRDWVPHAEARTMVESADVLLLLAQNQPDQVPNKLYEYLGTRRPILAFVDETGESARMLRQVGGHAVITGDDPDEAERAVARLLGCDGDRPEAPPSAAVLESWTTQAQMDRLIGALEQITR